MNYKIALMLAFAAASANSTVSANPTCDIIEGALVRNTEKMASKIASFKYIDDLNVSDTVTVDGTEVLNNGQLVTATDLDAALLGQFSKKKTEITAANTALTNFLNDTGVVKLKSSNNTIDNLEMNAILGLAQQADINTYATALKNFGEYDANSAFKARPAGLIGAIVNAIGLLDSITNTQECFVTALKIQGFIAKALAAMPETITVSGAISAPAGGVVAPAPAARDTGVSADDIRNAILSPVTKAVNDLAEKILKIDAEDILKKTEFQRYVNLKNILENHTWNAASAGVTAGILNGAVGTDRLIAAFKNYIAADAVGANGLAQGYAQALSGNGAAANTMPLQIGTRGFAAAAAAAITSGELDELMKKKLQIANVQPGVVNPNTAQLNALLAGKSVDPKRFQEVKNLAETKVKYKSSQSDPLSEKAVNGILAELRDRVSRSNLPALLEDYTQDMTKKITAKAASQAGKSLVLNQMDILERNIQKTLDLMQTNGSQQEILVGTQKQVDKEDILAAVRYFKEDAKYIALKAKLTTSSSTAEADAAKKAAEAADATKKAEAADAAKKAAEAADAAKKAEGEKAEGEKAEGEKAEGKKAEGEKANLEAGAVKITKDMKLPEAKKLIDSASLENKIDEEAGLKPAIRTIVKQHNNRVEKFDSFKNALDSEDTKGEVTAQSVKKGLSAIKNLGMALKNQNFLKAVTDEINDMEDGAVKKSVTAYVNSLKKPAPKKALPAKKPAPGKGAKNAQVKGGKKGQVKGGKKGQVKGGKKGQMLFSKSVQAKKAAAAAAQKESAEAAE